jgi:hypothetical protein
VNRRCRRQTRQTKTWKGKQNNLKTYKMKQNPNFKIERRNRKQKPKCCHGGFRDLAVAAVLVPSAFQPTSVSSKCGHSQKQGAGTGIKIFENAGVVQAVKSFR